MTNKEIKIVNLKNRLRDLCALETCHKRLQEDWSKANPFLGHDQIVTAIAYKKFGGDIIRAIIAETGFSYYYNRIDGKDYDLTKEQFEGNEITLVDAQISSLERILNDAQTEYKYNLLLASLEALPEESNDSI